MIQAIANMNLKNVKLLIFGTVATEMKAQFDKLINKNNIIFIGWLDSNQILDYLLIADLVIFPGTHSVLWEQAVGAGIPCVFKYWYGMDHIDIDGNCKFLYEDSVDEIENILKKIIINSDEFSEMKKSLQLQLKNLHTAVLHSVL